MAVTPRTVGSGLKGQTNRRGGCRSRRNMSQLVGVDDVITLKFVVMVRIRTSCRW